MNMNWLRVVPTALTLALASVSTLAGAYTVKSGDTLSKLRPHDWQQVCRANLLAHCGKIFVGQELVFPDGDLPQAAKPTLREAQEQSCIKLGVRPWNPEDDLQRTLEGIDRLQMLSPAQKALAKAKVIMGEWDTVDELVPEGQVFGEMLYASKRTGKPESVRNKPLCTPEQGGQVEVMKTIDLGNGIWFAKPRRCNNPSTLTRVVVPPASEPPAPVVTPPAPVTSMPEPAPTPEPEPKPEPREEPTPVVEAPKKGVCDFIDMAGALGQHHVPRQNGDRADSNFLTAVLDCQQRLESDDGSWGLGGKINYSNWKGTALQGRGHYKGYTALPQVSYREIYDDGRDWGAGVGVGRQRDAYHQAALAEQARYHLVGATWTYNDARRLLAGETFDVKRQYYAGINIPTSTRTTRTIFGQPMDASSVPRMRVGLQAGARWYVWQPEDSPVAFFLEGGLFVEHPISASVNLLGGIADSQHICGIGPGVDKDLRHGGKPVGAWSWNCDPFQGGRVARDGYRRHQFISDLERAGGSMDKEGMIRLPKNLLNK